MTMYEMVCSATVQGNIRVSAWCGCDEIVLLDVTNEDDLTTADLSEVWADQDITYIFCSGDGYLHIEVEAPKYFCVKEEYWDDWFGFTPDDEIGAIAFEELPEFARSHEKTIPELLEECEAY